MSVVTDTYTSLRLNNEVKVKQADDSVNSAKTSRLDLNEYRVVVFGTAGVGKSALVRRCLNNQFKEHYVPTVEDTHFKVIGCNDTVCTLKITDTGGSHSFPAMQELAIRGGHAFFLVFSLNEPNSLLYLNNIYQAIVQIKGKPIDHPMLLIGNKNDEDGRKVTDVNAKEKADLWKCHYLETSALNGDGSKAILENLFKLEKKRKLSLNVPTKPQRHSFIHRKPSSSRKSTSKKGEAVHRTMSEPVNRSTQRLELNKTKSTSGSTTTARTPNSASSKMNKHCLLM